MMNAIKYMDELEKKGFTKEQAKTTVNMWIELMNENLASKIDILKVENRIQEIQHEVKGLESRLIIKIGVIMAAGISLIAILQKL